jgi:hypothetical protein
VRSYPKYIKALRNLFLLQVGSLIKQKKHIRYQSGDLSSCMGYKILQMLFILEAFLVRTDHAAFKFLRNFAENNSRLMRWSLRLSEFDF